MMKKGKSKGKGKTEEVVLKKIGLKSDFVWLGQHL